MRIGSSLVTLFVLCMSANGQSTKKLPIEIGYRHFFAHIRQLDKQADDLEARGQSGEKYRAYYKKRLGLTDEQFTYVRDIAKDVRELNDIDNRARQQILAFREQRSQAKKGGIAKEGIAIPSELYALDRSRAKIILQKIDQIKTHVGVDASKAMDQVVNTEFIASSSTTPVITPSQQNARGRGVDFPRLEDNPIAK